MYEQRFSDNDVSRRDVPSFIEPRPPLISNPFMRPKPQKGTNLLELFEEDSDCEEPELVQVYLRLKPCNTPSNLYEVRSERCLITSLDTTTAGHGRRTQHNVSKMYTFSHIFGPETNQKEIFEHVVKDNLRKLPDGHNFTLLTYGASGSGKTYTLMGTVASPGLVPRSLEYVFRVVDAAQQPQYKPSEGGADKLNYAEQDYELQWVKRLRHVSAPLREKYRRMSARLCGDMTASTIDLSNRTRYYVWVSFVEIYNEAIYDLLAPGDRRTASKLLIREDSNGNVYVKGATQAFVRTGEEAYDVMVAGKHNLQVAATGVHAQSSRSHCIFTITMLTHTDEGVRISCVRLCDLAGCERARRTRNTGARMQESRAINSSLHVLERCLHTLRRKQRATKTALVPYRESKLTRLLGAGLSGARGEAVSMVVTLNPAPEYAHETRHVLQLAAVAKDIQINNTISDYASTLETSQDSTLGGAVDVMKLRAENERLHFELVQSQARNKQLCASMEERQAAAADMMREVVEEAKQITKQYYETQLTALRTEMEEMAEEYEGRLNSVVLPPTVETSSQSLQKKITELMTEIAILEEKLSAERLARARAEEEVQHLRACIEERDENAATSNEEVMSLTDSDNDSSDVEDDPCNESLEPTFKKEDINRSRLIRQSLLEQPSVHNESIDSSDKSEDSVLETSTDTIKDNKTNSLDDSYATGNESDLKKVDQTDCDIKRLTQTESLDKSDDVSLIKDTTLDKVEDKTSYFDDGMEIGANILKNVTIDNKKCYFDDEIEVKSNEFKNDTSFKSVCRGTYFVSEPKVQNVSAVKDFDNTIPTIDDIEVRKTMDIKNNSNALYETITQDNDVPEKIETYDIKKSITTQESMDVMDCDTEIVSEESKEVDDDKWEIPRKASETLVSKIISSLQSTTNSNSSLAQFEQLEKATRDCQSVGKEEADEFCNINILKEKRNYFDDITKEKTEESKTLERKTYFDNISVNLNKVADKRLTEIRSDIKTDDDLRSPSIVKEDVTNDFEPSTIKKLLGESITRHPDVTSTTQQVSDHNIKKILNKKCDSIDVFDSPQIPAVAATFDKNMEKLNEPIENIVLENKVKPKNVKIPAIKIEQSSLEKDFDKEEHNEPNHSFGNNLPLKDEKQATSIKQEDTVAPNINQSNTSSYKSDNTIEEFENIYKDITAPRATEFDLLVSQEVTESNNETVPEPPDTSQDKTKYNLRDRSLKLDKSKTNEDDNTKTKTTKRNLRLRRRKNMTDEERNEVDEMERDEKLKDIVNLQSEFSDVTIDVPAKEKEVRDIPSPEKVEMEENMPPMMGIQSCPSKR
ncbi:uncharacterized protein [Epargyreus clarus]|uniref:uncharacterized protein isoform X2 n=1 Tax=Epargyreus clarus TaxID=520877 RepID=UPI003C2ED121